MSIPFTGPWSDFPDGDRCVLSSWNAILPDPEKPGEFRSVQFVIEMRMQLVGGVVDAKGAPAQVEVST